jgi:hypothetical protein
MTTQATQNQEEIPNKKSDEEINHAKLRKQYEQEAAARKKAEERLAALEQQVQRYQSQPRMEAEGEDETDEPYVDPKYLNKKFSKWEEKMSSLIEQKAEEKARSLLDQEKQQAYVRQNPDIEEVLTAENIQKFAEKHPAIAERILRMPDNFDRRALVYEQIKALNAAQKEENKPSIQETIAQNRRSPYYQPSNVGSAPYALTGDFSPAGQKNAYNKLKEMQARSSARG